MKRPYKIATLARGYQLLARRPEFWSNDVGERLARATSDEGPGPLTAFDAILIAQSGPIDRVCAYAVVVLSRKGARVAELLDVLGMLDADRLVAIYYALPEERRDMVVRDATWAFHLSRAPRAAITEALRELAVTNSEAISEESATALSAVCGVGGAGR